MTVASAVRNACLPAVTNAFRPLMRRGVNRSSIACKNDMLQINQAFFCRPRQKNAAGDLLKQSTWFQQIRKRSKLFNQRFCRLLLDRQCHLTFLTGRFGFSRFDRSDADKFFSSDSQSLLKKSQKVPTPGTSPTLKPDTTAQKGIIFRSETQSVNDDRPIIIHSIADRSIAEGGRGAGPKTEY